MKQVRQGLESIVRGAHNIVRGANTASYLVVPGLASVGIACLGVFGMTMMYQLVSEQPTTADIVSTVVVAPILAASLPLALIGCKQGWDMYKEKKSRDKEREERYRSIATMGG